MTNTVSTLSGYFKEVYADKVEDLVPEGVHVYRDVPFVQKRQRNGNQYHQPVVVSQEHGFTYAAASAGAFSILSPIAAVHQDAQVTGSQLLLETRIDYETAARGDGSPKAFGAVTKHIVQNMVNSFYKRLEIEYLYGGSHAAWSGLARVGTRVSGGGTATQVFNIYTGTWASGIMSGLEGALLDCYDDDGTAEAPSTKLNTNADIAVSVVDFANKRLTLTGNSTDLDAIDSASATSSATYLFFKGAFGAEFTGFTGIAANTGTLFNIAAATYGLWAGNSYSCGSAPLTFNKLIKGHDGAVGRGLDETVTVYVNPGAWSNVMSDVAAMRRFDGSYSQKKLTNGTMGLEFAAQFGRLILKPHIMIKEGMALSLPTSECKRLGAVDMTFTVPGQSESFVYQLPSNAGYGIRAYANQAAFTPCPAKCTIFTDIVNS